MAPGHKSGRVQSLLYRITYGGGFFNSILERGGALRKPPVRDSLGTLQNRRLREAMRKLLLTGGFGSRQGT